MILESDPGQFVGLPEVIFKVIWKRGVNSSSAPHLTSVSRKERVAGVGKSHLLLSAASGMFICPGTASLLFRANTGRQCTMALSIPVQLVFAQKWKQPSCQLKVVRRWWAGANTTERFLSSLEIPVSNFAQKMMCHWSSLYSNTWFLFKLLLIFFFPIL